MEQIRTYNRDARRRGIALAEAALVMLLLCLVTLGALQYGWFFYCLHTATNAARQGARVAAVLNGTEAEGTAALQNNLSAALAAAATTKAVTFKGTEAWGEVVIPQDSPAVRLMPIALLPVPDCRATVVMAREG